MTRARVAFALAAAVMVAALLRAAWWLQTYVPPWRPVRRALHSEWVHVPAHAVLYAALWTLVARALRPWSRARPAAVAITLLAGGAQEAVQCVAYRRAPGAGEAADLLVDAAACALAWWVDRRRAGA